MSAQQVHVRDELLQLWTCEFHPLVQSHLSADALFQDERVREQHRRERALQGVPFDLGDGGLDDLETKKG